MLSSLDAFSYKFISVITYVMPYICPTHVKSNGYR